MVNETAAALHAIAMSSIFVFYYLVLPIVSVRWLVRKSPTWPVLTSLMLFFPILCVALGIFSIGFYVGALSVPHNSDKLLRQFGIGGWMHALAVTCFIGVREVRRRRREEG